jgi:hypothetical protein
MLADTGRHVDFVWDMRQSEEGAALAYVVKMELTLAPERTAMAGRVWTSLGGSLDEGGQDIVLVRYPDEPPPPATVCSGGEPSGACFLAPLRSDFIDEPRVVELGGGDLLLLWLNKRAIGHRIASSRFDAATGAWQPPEFLDDATAPVDAVLLAASPQGWAMVSYRQNSALLARVYDPKTRVWSEQQLVAADASSHAQQPEALFVYDGGDATLIASTQPIDGGSSTISAHDFAFATSAWENPQLIEASPKLATSQWAAASDADRHALVAWVRSARIGEPNEVWFSGRDAAGTWTSPALLHTSDNQILRPAMATGKDGTAILTWQEFLLRIASSTYSFETGAWSEPLTVTSKTQIENRAVAFDDAGAPVAYFYDSSSLSGNGELKSELGDGGWGSPQMASAEEVSGATYAATRAADSIEVERVHPRAGERALPAVTLPRCDGY